MRTCTTLALWAAALPFAFGQTSPIRTVHSFNRADGGGPNCLIRASNGFFYGTAAIGGKDVPALSDGCGVIFRLDAAGNFAVLHEFDTTDGYSPIGLMQGKDGNFYGTTGVGGMLTGGGAGTVFRMDLAGHTTTLHAFVGGFAPGDGAAPAGPPIQAADGFLYGVTRAGGPFRDIDHQGGFGTAYRVDPVTGATTILHSFNINDPNGIFPSGPLLQGADGAFYGTTREGALGGGSVFRMTSAGVVTLLKAFTESGEPLDGVVQASDGMLYGTTDGASGTVFRVSTTGTNYTVLNRFDGADGYRPHLSAVQFAPGTLYGNTPQGGFLDFQGGAIYRLGTGGTLVVLHSFDRNLPNNGFIPNSRMIMGGDGALYGTTGIMGALGHGTIFRFDQRIGGPVASISVPAKLMTGDVSSGTVTLSAAAPAGGTVVAIGLQTYQATAPSSITIPAGATTGTFPIKVGTVGAVQTFRVYASVGGRGVRTTMTLLMLPTMSSLGLSPLTVAGGSTSTATVKLSGPAPLAGATITLTSSSSKASIPASVKVPGGATSVTFTVKAMRVKATSAATISATYNGTTSIAVLTITP